MRWRKAPGSTPWWRGALIGPFIWLFEVILDPVVQLVADMWWSVANQRFVTTSWLLFFGMFGLLVTYAEGWLGVEALTAALFLYVVTWVRHFQ